MIRLPALNLLSDAVSHDAVIDRSIHESISLYVMVLNRDTPNEQIDYTLIVHKSAF